MTEKEAWLDWGKRCTEKVDPVCMPGLCLWSTRLPEMREHLQLFCPTGMTCDDYWWRWTPRGIAERATACCFLAAMCDD